MKASSLLASTPVYTLLAVRVDVARYKVDRRLKALHFQLMRDLPLIFDGRHAGVTARTIVEAQKRTFAAHGLTP